MLVKATAFVVVVNLVGHRQRAGAVVGNGRGHIEHAAVVLDAGLMGAAAHLAQRVAVGAGLGCK